jgi:ubiquinone/menaquinone biosynthesis C-methylase UbiE
MKSLDTFNWLAGSYDSIVKIIFGNALDSAQAAYLKDIPPNSNVLILGGGTGWNLVELIRINPSARVWYIEASSSMIKSAKKKIKATYPQAQIYFIHGTENSIPETAFDAVITNFFLDLFSPITLGKVIRKIKPFLSTNAVWLVSDFISQDKYWQKALLKLMYFFFQKTCGIESSQLPQWESELSNAGLKEMRSKMFFRSFIKSAVFELNKC